MKRILIFSGTTEGKRLAELLAAAGVPCMVCVATEYGELVMPELPGVLIHQGRMDAEEMRAFIEEGGYGAVVDATHPYAVEVTHNIKKSLDGLDLPYHRLVRNTHLLDRGRTAEGRVEWFSTSAECAKALIHTKGNILLTTGSKELFLYAEEESVRQRLFVRVLPSEESIRLCRENGIEGKQIIALQGPFSEGMNEALLKQYGISCMVTKESGAAGGFMEKYNAAKALGVDLYVIGSPKEEGESFEEVCRSLSKLTETALAVDCHLDIYLIGIGMGNPDTLTLEAAQRIRKADVLFGAGRVLDSIPLDMTEAMRRPVYLSGDILPALREMTGDRRVAVLFSGDSGFYSGCRNLYRSLAEAPEFGNVWKVRVIPGISSVSYLAAALGQSWQESEILSVHGRSGNEDYGAEILEAVRFHERTYLIVSGREDVQKTCRLLCGYVENELKNGSAAGEMPPRKERFIIYAGYRLSYPEEQILKLLPQQYEMIEKQGLYTCLIVNQEPEKKTVSHGIADSAFLRAAVPMTKEEIREVSICKLHLQEDSVLYDVGSGTGSIAVEAAARSGKITVYAIEKKPEAAELIRRNAEHFRTPNIKVVEGTAPEVLLQLPPPTHAFIGGSSGNLKEILDCLYEKNNRMRIVINSVSLETISEITGILPKLYLEEYEIVSLSVSRSRRAGQHHLMQAENPIYVVSFTFCEKH